MKKALLALGLAVLLGCTAHAQTTMQFPTTPWGGYAPARVECGRLLGANFNATTDQAIVVSVPSATYLIGAITIANPSASLTTAAGGFYTATSKGGVAVVANTQAYSTLTTNAANTTGNAMAATLATAGNTTALNVKTLYLSLTTAQGTAATADVRVFCQPQY